MPRKISSVQYNKLKVCWKRCGVVAARQLQPLQQLFSWDAETMIANGMINWSNRTLQVSEQISGMSMPRKL